MYLSLFRSIQIQILLQLLKSFVLFSRVVLTFSCETNMIPCYTVCGATQTVQWMLLLFLLLVSESVLAILFLVHQRPVLHHLLVR